MIRRNESAIAQLPPAELAEIAVCFEEFLAQVWDKQIEEDIQAGRLDSILRQVDQEEVRGC